MPLSSSPIFLLSPGCDRRPSRNPPQRNPLGGKIELHGNLGFHAREKIADHRHPLRIVAVEQRWFGVTIDDRGEFPSEIERILDTEIHADAASRVVNARGSSPTRKMLPWRSAGTQRIVSSKRDAQRKLVMP